MSLKEKILFWLAYLRALGIKATARFIGDTRAESDIAAPIMLVIGGIIWVICVPIFIDEVAGVNTTAWNFTGASGAATLFQLMPFALIAGGIVWLLKKVL